MLAELSIKNFAIIEELTVSFERGLTVLTGETGAGKSIIIDAISLLVGGRGSSEFVRYGEAKAELEGLFLLESGHPVLGVCAEQGIDVSDEMIVMRRDISTSGKSVCRVNGKLVTIASLREIGRLLLDIHGQHDNQLLMEDENHLQLLDKFAGAEVESALKTYQEGYQRYVKLLKSLSSFLKANRKWPIVLILFNFSSKKSNRQSLSLTKMNSSKKSASKFQTLRRYMSRCKMHITRFAVSRADWTGLEWHQRSLKIYLI